MRRLRSSIGLAIALVGLSAGIAATSPVAAAPAERSTYIVTFVDGTNARAEAARLRAQNYTVSYVYENLFPGVAVELPAAAAQALANNPQVALVEPDGVVTATDVQTPATWGIDRVDQRALPLNNSYVYQTDPGLGVTAYIIDTGILASHADFEGRVSGGYTAISDGNGTNDCNGHGTHVAGTVAGKTWGLAKKAALVPVRVLDCGGSGSWTGVIAGMDWVAGNATNPAVANMSLGGGASSSVDSAVQRLVDSGVTVAVAAGNSNLNACNYSPARAPAAITVGSTTSSDSRSSFSNFGSCVDIFAPGSSITSTWIGSNTATNTISGTSMASPHVAGAAAVVLGQSKTMTPAQVTAQLTGTSSTGVVSNAGTGSPNRLLFSDPGPLTAQALTITTTSLPNGKVNTSYNSTLTAIGGAETYTWSKGSSQGWADSKLGVSANGVISGTPTTVGTFSLDVTVSDGQTTTSTTLSVTINPLSPPGAFSKSSPGDGSRISTRTSVTVSWTASSGATSYRVCISRTTPCNTWYGPYTSRSVKFSGLSSNTRYYWQVQASNSDGQTLANGGAQWSFLTAL